MFLLEALYGVAAKLEHITTKIISEVVEVIGDVESAGIRLSG